MQVSKQFAVDGGRNTKRREARAGEGASGHTLHRAAPTTAPRRFSHRIHRLHAAFQAGTLGHGRPEQRHNRNNQSWFGEGGSRIRVLMLPVLLLVAFSPPPNMTGPFSGGGGLLTEAHVSAHTPLMCCRVPITPLPRQVGALPPPPCSMNVY